MGKQQRILYVTTLGFDTPRDHYSNVHKWWNYSQYAHQPSDTTVKCRAENLGQVQKVTPTPNSRTEWGTIVTDKCTIIVRR